MQNEISYFGRDLEIYQQALADAIDVVENMAPMTQEQALIDTDTLAASLYNRFHKDRQMNNITMVPLGEVIQFVKELSAIDKESVIESEIESEQDAEYDYERD